MDERIRKFVCECGRPRHRRLPYCQVCAEEREAQRRSEALEVVQSGRCPTCGGPLAQKWAPIIRTALAGVWQCSSCEYQVVLL